MLKKFKIIGLVFTVLCTFFAISTMYQPTLSKITPAAESQFKSIIFDLGGVLLATKSSTKNLLIARTIVKNPTLLYYLINFDTKGEYFKLLHSVPAQSTQVMYHESKPMPQIMVDWQINAAPTAQIHEQVNAHIKASNHPEPIKNLFIAIAQYMFTPESIVSSQAPINEMINLARQFKASGYQLYALSNWDKDSFEIMEKTHPELFNMFDGMLISGREQMGKPCPAFFQKLCTTYKLKPKQCIFIDDEFHNVESAHALGMTGFCQKNYGQCVTNLYDLGVLTPS